MKSILVELHCPHCAYQTHVKSETLIHATFESEQKEKIVNDTFFSRSCKRCHKRIHFLHECMYVDPLHHFIILLKMKDSSTESAIHNLTQMKYYRFVTTYEQLKEKIAIFEDGFHDYPMEHLKHTISKKLHIKPSNIFYKDYDYKSQTIWFIAENEVKGVSKTFYDRYARIQYDEKNEFITIDASLFKS